MDVERRSQRYELVVEDLPLAVLDPSYGRAVYLETTRGKPAGHVFKGDRRLSRETYLA